MSEKINEIKLDSKRKKLNSRLIGWFFGIQAISLAIWGVSYFFYSMLGIVFDFGDIYIFRETFVYVVISLVVVLLIEIYVYSKCVKKRKLKVFNERLKYYNELISNSPKLKCFICNERSKIEILSFSWKYGLLSEHFSLKKPGLKKHKILLPICYRCSQNLGDWRMAQSLDKIFPIALLGGFILLLYVVFFVHLILFLFLGPGLAYIFNIVFIDRSLAIDPDFYIYGHLDGEITVTQDVFTKPMPYDDWIRSA